MSPDLKAFIADTEKADFQIGIEAGKWGIEDFNPQYPTWPIVTMWVQAATKQNQPDKYFFKFDLTNYPAHAPTACIWDIQQNTTLTFALRPNGNEYVTAAFHSTFYGGNCLYIPCDRNAMVNHPNWPHQYPNLYWRSTFTIFTYLNHVHVLLAR